MLWMYLKAFVWSTASKMSRKPENIWYYDYRAREMINEIDIKKRLS